MAKENFYDINKISKLINTKYNIIYVERYYGIKIALIKRVLKDIEKSCEERSNITKQL